MVARRSRIGGILNVGGVAVGVAVRSWSDANKAHRADVWAFDRAGWYPGCYVVNGQGNRIKAPSETWDGTVDTTRHPYVLLALREAGANPLVLCRLDLPGIDYVPASGRTSNYDPETDDTPAAATVNDVVYGTSETQLVFRDEAAGGDVILEAQRHVSFQLPNGVLRVSNGGATDDGPVLASRHVRRDQQVYEALQSIFSFLQSLTIANPTGTIIGAPTIPFIPPSLEPLNQNAIQSSLVRLPSTTSAGDELEPTSAEGETT